MRRNNGRALVVLLIEDNPGDARLVREAFTASGVHCALHLLEDAGETMGWLRKEGRFSASPRPDLVLLDLNLPVEDGRSLLGEIKRDPRLKRIPVLVLTSSDAPQDVRTCYDLGANGFVKKPGTLSEFMASLRRVIEFWGRTAILPGE